MTTLGIIGWSLSVGGKVVVRDSLEILMSVSLRKQVASVYCCHEQVLKVYLTLAFLHA